MVMGDDLLPSSSSSTSTSIKSSNIGFQLLKKHGWKEGTGLGLSEQGRLEPVQVHLKMNKRGLGADRVKSSASKPPANLVSTTVDENERRSSKKAKVLSKKMRMAQALEKQLQEKEFERAFYREFWPENV